MDKGFDSILVFDDLSKHSVAYRQITLLLRRPPGREAFPGDVFFLHSRLLERSAQLSSNNGEGSMTSLPIIETLCGDVSSYIPTNVISITDGQIFLNKELLNRGVLPAVDLNLSVSRVGSSSQYKYMVSVSKKIKMQLAMYRQFKDAELLGTDSNENVKNYVNRGKRLILLFTQPLYHTQNYLKQIIYLYCLSEGFADKIDLKLTKFFLSSIFNSKFYIYIPSDISVFFIDFFRNLETCEDHFVIFDFDVIHSKLYKLLFYYTVFFESNIVPIINSFKDQSYMESLISKYNDSF
jgi:F-type H+-transporting ATPase subunit alpha